jgi:hypothetical protein
LLGYQRVSLSSTSGELLASYQAAFAKREGWGPGEVFLVAGRTPQPWVLAELAGAVQRMGAQAIAVPAATDLGHDAGEQQQMRASIEARAGGPVVIVRAPS